MHDQNLNFVLPTGVSEKALDSWSSFPSDHVMLYFGFAVGILAVSRRLGSIAILYTLIFIGLPRIYTGYHYPTDILGGMVFGGILMLISVYFFGNSHIIAWINDWSENRPGAFYALFFLTTHQIANLFYESRNIVELLYRGAAH